MRRSAVAALLLCGLVAVSRGDEGDEPEVESSEARAALAQLDKKIQSRAWAEAIASARVVSEQHGDDLIAVGSKSYLPARRLARRALAAIPEAGRRAIEHGFGEQARSLLEAARAKGDPAALEAVADRFVALDAGAEALVAAGDRWLERGALVFALAAWREVALESPWPPWRKEALRRLEGALPLLGSPSTCAELADALDADEAAPFRALAAAPLAGIEDVGVDASGNVAPLGSFALPRAARWTARTHEALPAELDWRDRGRALRFVPSFTAGSLGTEDRIVLHLGRVLVALDAETGSERWRHEDRGAARSFARLARAPLSTRFGVTHERSRLYATLETDALIPGTPRGDLVALDGRTGKLAWSALEPERTDPSVESDDELSFTGTPLVGGARVFCGAESALDAGETWVTASDPATGRLLWRRHLAVTEAARGAAMGRRRRIVLVSGGRVPAISRLPAPVLGFVKGALVVASGNGLLAALDPADGRALWARTYGSGASAPATDGSDPAREANPILALRGLALVLPPDADALLLVRALDGVVTDSTTRLAARALLGVTKGDVVVQATDAVRVFTIGRDETIASWTSHGAASAGKPLGRGVLASSGVVAIPLGGGLARLDLGGLDEPLVSAWPEVERSPAGDLLVAHGRLVSVGVLAAASWGE